MNFTHEFLKSTTGLSPPYNTHGGTIAGVLAAFSKSPETPAGMIGVRTKLGKWRGGANVRVLRR